MANTVLACAPTDAELVRSAQPGDMGSLGLLLARHQSGMRAVAINILGYGPDADDAVQDGAMVALLRIGDVRDPHAVGPWLRAVVPKACGMQLRARTDVPVGAVGALAARVSPIWRSSWTGLPPGTGCGPLWKCCLRTCDW
jgi:DNA-directed RNA polymerase specialized sigma24 family protein